MRHNEETIKAECVLVQEVAFCESKEPGYEEWQTNGSKAYQETI
jgi:hypothetical protein